MTARSSERAKDKRKTRIHDDMSNAAIDAVSSAGTRPRSDPVFVTGVVIAIFFQAKVFLTGLR